MVQVLDIDLIDLQSLQRFIGFLGDIVLSVTAGLSGIHFGVYCEAVTGLDGPESYFRRSWCVRGVSTSRVDLVIAMLCKCIQKSIDFCGSVKARYCIYLLITDLCQLAHWDE